MPRRCKNKNACQLCRFHGIYIEIKQSNHFWWYTEDLIKDHCSTPVTFSLILALQWCHVVCSTSTGLDAMESKDSNGFILPSRSCFTVGFAAMAAMKGTFSSQVTACMPHSTRLFLFSSIIVISISYQTTVLLCTSSPKSKVFKENHNLIRIIRISDATCQPDP
jgi:hypothetical protein